MIFNFFRIDIDANLDMLRSYQADMQRQLEIIQKDESDRIKGVLTTIEDLAEQEFYLDTAGDEFHYTHEVMFPRSQRYSFIVLLFLNLERMLTRFCDHVKKEGKHEIRVTDFKGDIVARSRTYLHKYAKVPEADKRFWDAIEDLSKVRNCIVHTYGQVEHSSDKKRLQDIANMNHGLSIGDYDLDQGHIVLEPGYCEKAILDVSALMTELFDKAGFPPAIRK